MPLNCSLRDPFTMTINDDAYAWASVVAFDNLRKTMRIVYLIHSSRNAAFQGGASYPNAVEILIGPEAVEAADGRPRIPSYDEVVGQHMPLFAGIADAVDALALAVAPEFVDASLIPRS